MSNDFPNRRSIRLKGYDYSQKGLYFITICSEDHEIIFGRVENKKMILNDIGLIAENEWYHTMSLRPKIKLHEFVVMPNHLHGIIEITHEIPGPIKKNITDNEPPKSMENPQTVGAYCIRPEIMGHQPEEEPQNSLNKSYTYVNNILNGQEFLVDDTTGTYGAENPLRSPSQTIGAIVRGFKSAVTKQVNEISDKRHKKLWQRNYYEHIIRNETAYSEILYYIKTNPQNWKNDVFYKP